MSLHSTRLTHTYYIVGLAKYVLKQLIINSYKPLVTPASTHSHCFTFVTQSYNLKFAQDRHIYSNVLYNGFPTKNVSMF
jgi:hypothetical protein